MYFRTNLDWLSVLESGGEAARLVSITLKFSMVLATTNFSMGHIIDHTKTAPAIAGFSWVLSRLVWMDSLSPYVTSSLNVVVIHLNWRFNLALNWLKVYDL
jgi:hypothetical protein